MMADPGLIAGTSACCGVVISMITQWRQRRNFRREAAALREALEVRGNECSRRFEALRNACQTLEGSLDSTRHVLRNGRLSRSTRAAALQLLRTGMSADSAASSLGLPRREMQMLVRVAALLSATSAENRFKGGVENADMNNTRLYGQT